MSLHRNTGNPTNMSRLKYAKFPRGENPVVMNNVPMNDKGTTWINRSGLS